MMLRFLVVSVSLIALFLTGCGGPSKEARVAQFLQNILVESISSVVLGSSDDGQSVEFNCTKGGSLAINFEVETNIIGGIDNLDDLEVEVLLSAILSFDQCKIDACGEVVGLTGGGVSLNLGNAADYLEGLSGGQGNGTGINLVINAQNLSAEGYVNGDLSFAYRLKAVVPEGGMGLQNLNISDPDPIDTSTQLNYMGKNYSGPELVTLPSGC